VKEIVVRAAQRLAVSAIFVANKTIRLPASRHVSTVRVAMGLDVADGYIAKAAETGDLAITADIPLAAALVARGARCSTRAVPSTRRRTSARRSRCATSITSCARAAS
jgi:uncharacterized protein YaiI (UPF0178 family)